MNAIVRKAKAGVTLVELLVVILIVTILSVSMLPLLQPFVTEAQYAAEAIPVIGSIRTNVGTRQYDKGKLPCIVEEDKATGVLTSNPIVETWAYTTDGNSVSTTVADQFMQAQYQFQALSGTATKQPLTPAQQEIGHIGKQCSIDYSELKGKRSKPAHYQYLVMKNGADYAYFVGCFGDGEGLKAGTGYAVCEIVCSSQGRKYIGTWKRYKPYGTSGGQSTCSSDTTPAAGTSASEGITVNCYVPDDLKQATWAGGTGGQMLTLVSGMKNYGWEFD